MIEEERGSIEAVRTGSGGDVDAVALAGDHGQRSLPWRSRVPLPAGSDWEWERTSATAINVKDQVRQANQLVERRLGAIPPGADFFWCGPELRCCALQGSPKNELSCIEVDRLAVGACSSFVLIRYISSFILMKDQGDVAAKSV